MPKDVAASKYMSFALRHDPAAAGLVLDTEGWTPVSELLRALGAAGHALSDDDLKSLVASDSKGRYSYSPDGLRIRANQGHSTADVKLTFKEAQPPTFLYHGTTMANLDAILKDGLSKMSRHHVHLSDNIETAKIVGGRRGKPIILEVCAVDMYAHGHKFYLSDNGVWLTDHVPPLHILVL